MTTRSTQSHPPGALRRGIRATCAQPLVLLALVGTTGCANQDPIARWCRDAETHIAEHAADANLLRSYAAQTSSPSDRPALLRFSTLGVPVGFAGERDVLGVLVGVASVDCKPWYVFLIATVRVPGRSTYPETPDAIVDVRAVGLRRDGQDCQWVVGEPAPIATRRYVEGRAGEAADLSAHMLFPGRTDVFALEVIDSTVIVTERRSTARWRLELPSE